MKAYTIKKFNTFKSEDGESWFFKFKNKSYVAFCPDNAGNGDKIKIYDVNIMHFGLALGEFTLAESDWMENKKRIQKVLRKWINLKK